MILHHGLPCVVFIIFEFFLWTFDCPLFSFLYFSFIQVQISICLRFFQSILDLIFVKKNFLLQLYFLSLSSLFNLFQQHKVLLPFSGCLVTFSLKIVFLQTTCYICISCLILIFQSLFLYCVPKKIKKILFSAFLLHPYLLCLLTLILSTLK